MAVLGGTNWYCSPDSGQGSLSSYIIGGSTGTNILSGQAERLDFVAAPANKTISGHLEDTNSAPISGVSVWAQASINGVSYQAANQLTDSNGFYSINVSPGLWTVGINCQGGGQSLGSYGSYQCPNAQSTNIVNNNAVIDFTALPCGPLQVATTNLPDGSQYQQYFAQLQANGCSQPFSWSVVSGSLPGNFNLDAYGNLNGYPTNSGMFQFTVRVTDANTNTADQALSLNINSLAPLQITTVSLPEGTNGLPYSQQLTAVGGVLPYVWSLAPASPGLPPSLSLSTNGPISGTASTDGMFGFTARVTDQIGASR